MAFPNHFSQEMALHHFSEQNSSALCNILPEQMAAHSPEHHHRPPTWLNSAILRQQSQFSSTGNENFLNLQTNSDSTAEPSQVSNNQWFLRSVLQRNVSDVRDDVQVSSDSMIGASISHESTDLNNHHNNNTHSGRNENNELTEGGSGGGEGVINWQNSRYKAEILSHPLYEQLLSAHVACLRIATPVDQLPRIEAKLEQSQQVVAKYSTLQHENQGDDKELDQFMFIGKRQHTAGDGDSRSPNIVKIRSSDTSTSECEDITSTESESQIHDRIELVTTHYVLLLCSFKEQLQQHVRVHAMEAVMACWQIEQLLQSITGVSAGEGTGATMSDDDEDQVESDVNMFDGTGSVDGADSMGFGPLIPTESERSLMERVRHELKHELKQGYKEKIVDIREEILRKRRAGKLPGDTTSALKAWWQSHSKWPYPTEEDKAILVQETGLQLKQINNWFINQRKRNWHSTPSSSTSLKSKHKKVKTGTIISRN